MAATDDDYAAGSLDSRGRSLKRRRGPAPIAAADRRVHRVSVYLSDAEVAALDDLRGGISRGRYLRTASLDTPPPQIPSVNIEAWRSLAPVASNLNQIASRLNVEADVSVEEVRTQLQKLRAGMIGFVPPVDDDDEGSTSDEG